MASTSDRRSGSSGGSARSRGSKREPVFISSKNPDRAVEGLRAAAEAPVPRASKGRDGRGRPGRRQPVAAEQPSARPFSVAAREAQARREQRDGRLAAQRRRARTRATLIAGAVIAVLVSCTALYRSPLLAVKRVEVVGAVHVSAARVRALAKVPADATLIRFPADAVAARVATDPWVASVTVSRLFPDGMRIRIVEREPVAMVDTGTQFWLIDGGGMVIAKRSGEDTATTVVIRDVPGLDLKPGRRTTSEPLLNSLAVLRGISARLRAMIGAISAPTIDGTTLYTRDKVEIVFGDAADVKTKDALVLRILDDHRGRVVSIDVRTIDRPTWRGFPK